jgi:hypothetical protein
MSEVKLTKGAKKPHRIVKGIKHTVHLRNLTDEQYEELWSLRAFINAFDWIDVVNWTLEKYKNELEQLRVIP